MKGNDIITGILIGYVVIRCGELLAPWIIKKLQGNQKIVRPQTEGQTKRALLIGCNYPGSKAELGGCHNDVKQQKALLKDIYGFQENDITVMIDGGNCKDKPTKKNIIKKLKEFIDDKEFMKEGNILFMHFSGHGIQIPTDDPSEEDHLDEALVTADMNLIIDDDLREIAQKMNQGVKFTFVADCCHSGSMLDGPPAVIKGDKTRDLQLLSVKKRELPVDQYREIIGGQQNTGWTTRELVKEKFGKEETSQRLRDNKFSYKYKLKKEAMGKKVPSSSVLSTNLLSDDVGILITGCQDFETSADATMGGCAFGAMTNALVTVIRQHYRLFPDQEITYMELVLQLRHLLAEQGYTQNPCLECSPQNAHKAYLLIQ